MATNLQLSTFQIENPNELNFVLGHAHFIQTVDDIAEICARHAIPKFGAAFCEASEGHDAEVPGRRVRTEGNDDSLINLAAKNALSIGAGHTFLLFMDGGFPISVLNAIKASPTVCRVYCATSNPTTVVIASLEEHKKGIAGVIDGMTSVAIEDEKDKKARKEFLKMIGYKR
ncbi:hypothetical protein NADE_003495 [Nannochloris sp. 'desiccata']|nr:hypothetical protein KSW81_000476 [Chlorella desiccata (nom. nud.)]KAH7620886.1 hypothetical protein NADE_003495 [Chlorella desiccata (nom. nud.)]